MSVGVYIPGMEMPKGCASCKISRRNGKKMICQFIWKCEWDIHDPMSADHRLDGCPLVPVPPHGRLIDADALINTLQELFDLREKDATFTGNRGAFVTWNDAIYHIKSAPTVIPAEEGER